MCAAMQDWGDSCEDTGRAYLRIIEIFVVVFFKLNIYVPYLSIWVITSGKRKAEKVNGAVVE